MLNRSASLAMSTSVLKTLPGKLDIKRHSSSILYIIIPHPDPLISYSRCISKNIVLLARAFRSQMVIPDFNTFCEHVDEIYWNARDMMGGKVSRF